MLPLVDLVTVQYVWWNQGKRGHARIIPQGRAADFRARVGRPAYSFGACPAILSYNCPRLSWALA